MRFSSLVSLVVVTASLALGGCAADAETASTGDNVTKGGELDNSRIRDVRAINQRSDEAPSAFADATRARKIETHGSGAVDPRLDALPPAFGDVQRFSNEVAIEDRVKERDGIVLGQQGASLSADEMVGVVDDHTAAAKK